MRWDIGRRHFLASLVAGSAASAATIALAQPAAPTPQPAPPETAPAPAPTPAPPAPATAAPQPSAPQPGSVQKLPINEASGILGRGVKGANGRDIGRIIDVVVDQSGQPRAAVIDFGGFMGVGSRKIAVDWSMLHFSPGDPTVPITLDLTPDQIKAAPEYRESAARPPAVVGQPVAPPPPPPSAPPASPAPPSPPAAKL